MSHDRESPPMTREQIEEAIRDLNDPGRKERARLKAALAAAERERDDARARNERMDKWLLARARKDRDGWRAEHGHAWRHVEEARAEAARYREALERIESCDMTATTRADLCNLARAALDAKEDSRG